MLQHHQQDWPELQPLEKLPTIRAMSSFMSVGSCGQVVQCDRCQSSWKCADCLNLSKDVYDALLADSGPNLKWFCYNCDKEVSESKYEGTASASSKLDRNLMSNFMETLGNTDNKLKEKTAAAVTTQLGARIKNMEERLLKFEDRVISSDDKIAKQEARLVTIEKGHINQTSDAQGSKQVSVEANVQEAVYKKLDEDKDIEAWKNNIIIQRP